MASLTVILLSLVQMGYIFRSLLRGKKGICLNDWGCGASMSWGTSNENVALHAILIYSKQAFWNTCLFGPVSCSLETMRHWKVFSTAGLILNSSWRQQAALRRALTIRLALKVCVNTLIDHHNVTDIFSPRNISIYPGKWICSWADDISIKTKVDVLHPSSHQ
jgi:hypothetical protein